MNGKAKKIAGGIFLGLGFVAVIAGIVLAVLGKSKMGLARFFTYRTQQLQQDIPLDALLWALGFAGLFLMAFFVGRLARGGYRGLGSKVLAGLAALFAAAFLVSALGFSYPGLRAYYGLVFLAALGLLLAAFAVGLLQAPAPGPYEGMDEEERALARTSRIARWATAAVLAAAIVAVLAIPPAHEAFSVAMADLSSGDIGAVAELIRSFGPWAALVSCLLMIFQSVAAPIPAFLITFANAAVFGWWQGAILSWCSSMLGALLCFGIARLLGRDAVARFVSRGALASIDRFFERYGDKSILVCRLLPFMSFDYVSYAAGLTGVSVWGFVWATGLGQLPATIVYSYVGGMLTGTAQIVMMALLILGALFFAIVIFKQAFSQRHKALMVGESDVAAEAADRLRDRP